MQVQPTSASVHGSAFLARAWQSRRETAPEASAGKLWREAFHQDLAKGLPQRHRRSAQFRVARRICARGRLKACGSVTRPRTVRETARASQGTGFPGKAPGCVARTANQAAPVAPGRDRRRTSRTGRQSAGGLHPGPGRRPMTISHSRIGIEEENHERQRRGLARACEQKVEEACRWRSAYVESSAGLSVGAHRAK